MPTVMDMTYTYADGANNGRITKQKDAVSGEEISYQYDALNRLIAASTTDTSWGLSFSYDGFGNRLNQVVTKGSAKPMYLDVNQSNNRITTAGYSYDNNGNLLTMPLGPTMTYDVENRLQLSTTSPCAYGLDNKRVVDWAAQRLYFYTPDGRKAATHAISGGSVCDPTCRPVYTFLTQGFNFYFAGKLVESNGALLITDRLGSVGNPAPRGSIVSIFATGEGQTNPAGKDGAIIRAPAPLPLLPVDVLVGGILANIEYTGGAPGEVAGLLQVNLKVPDDTGSGAQPVVLRVGDASSQAGVYLSIA